MKKVGLLISLLALSTYTFAECDFKKAARNKMLDQKIGISGNCDTQKAVKTQTTNKIDNALDIDSKKIKNDSFEKKDSIEKKTSTTKKVVEAIK
ncbi:MULTISPECIES: hypothetical protein [unclassified Providencia]|uniref:hypothetical protein n=1 Tax=unclassified Providencia TaxID=2633465 RepID=UPI000E847357|nr:hypothetical protein [Providencia sp.]MBP6080582.1 hypothetical protein [Providencia sp.]HBO22816.1 hypothetical protein [Providencia sp.]